MSANSSFWADGTLNIGSFRVMLVSTKALGYDNNGSGLRVTTVFGVRDGRSFKTTSAES